VLEYRIVKSQNSRASPTVYHYFKDFPGPIIPKENTPGPSKLGEAKAAPPEPVDD